MRLPTAAATAAALLLGAVPADASYVRVTGGGDNGVHGGQAGLMYHFGVGSLHATGDDPVTVVGIGFGSADGAVRRVDGFLTSLSGPGAILGGDEGNLARKIPGATFVPVRGATIRPGDDGWLLVVTVVPDRPGTLTTDDVVVTYRTAWGSYTSARIDYDLTFDITS